MSASSRKKIALAALAFALVGAAGLGIVVRRADPTALIETALKEIRQQLPFEIESVEIRKSWRELIRGRLSSLSVTLKWGSFRIRLIGPVEIKKDAKDEDVVVSYDPEFTIEPAGHPDQAATPLGLHLWVEANRTFREVHALGLSTHAPHWKWGPLGVRLAGMTAIAGWRGDRLESRVLAEGVNYEAPTSGNPTVELKGLRFSLGSRLTLTPFAAGRDTEIHLDGRSVDLLWNGTLVSLPLEKIPLRVRAQIDAAAPAIDGDLKLGSMARVQWAVRGKEGTPQSARLSWEIPEFDLREASARLATIIPQWEPMIRAAGLRSGHLTTRGTAQTLVPLLQGHLPEVEGRLTISGLSLHPDSQPLLLQGAEFDLPFSTRKGVQGHVALKRAAYKHLEAALDPVPLTIRPTADFQTFEFLLGNGGRLPLRAGDLALSVGSLSGKIHLPPRAKPEFMLETSLALGPVEITRLTRPLCIKNELPPARIDLQFPRIEITQDAIDPTGQARAELFGGVIEADEIGIFDLGSPVPELDFTAEMRNIRLEKIGEWLNFGEMKGSLEGYARDVTFQSWLPTRFDARIEVKPPADRARVVFSPAAVQNFVEVVAGSRLENIPGLVKWYAFGTPRYIFGGYDIDYAGAKLNSSEGVIELETLDPPEIYKKEKKHFILYGASIMDRVPVIGAVAWGGFRVPIQSPRYPVLMDAPAIANYIRQLTERLKALSERTNQPQEKTDAEPDLECEPPENPPG